jgi:hypothetical protein
VHKEVKLQLKSYQYFPNSHGPAQKAQVKRAMKKQEEHEKSEIKRGLTFTYGPAKGLSLNEPRLPGPLTSITFSNNQQTILQNSFPVKKCAGKVRALMLSRYIYQI